MKKFISIIGLIFIITALLSPVVLTAQETKVDYVPLESLSISSNSEILNDDGSTNLQTYLPGMLRIFFGVTSALAVIFIIIGGLEYVTAESVNSKSDGKQKIQAVIFGIIILAISWALLNTINPALLKIDLSEESLHISDEELEALGANQEISSDPTKYCLLVNGTVKACGLTREEAYARLQSLPAREGQEATLEEDRLIRITYTKPLSPESPFSPDPDYGDIKVGVFNNLEGANDFIVKELHPKFAKVDGLARITLSDGTPAIRVIYRLTELTYLKETEVISRRDLREKRDEIVAAGGIISSEVITIINTDE
jgi:hypothetical protein